MRATILFTAIACLQLYAQSQPLPEKVRTDAQKSDQRAALLKQAWQANFEKSIELKNRIATLRERVNEARTPTNRERFENALANVEAQFAALDATMDAQRQELADLSANRGMMAAALTTRKTEQDEAHRAAREAHREELAAARAEKAVPVAHSAPRVNPEQKPSKCLRVLGSLSGALLSSLFESEDYDSELEETSRPRQQPHPENPLTRVEDPTILPPAARRQR